MAKSVQTTAGLIKIPGAYARYTVAQSVTGLATNGILMLLGEADGGPDYTLESDLELNAFGPEQMGEVEAKYVSGPLVDGFRAAINAANDEEIPGALQAVILVKTNASTKASGTLLKHDASDYADLLDRNYGDNALISFQTEANAAEVVPTTGPFTYIPPAGALNYRIRVNGGGAVGTSIAANTTPTVFVSTIAALAGVIATGGVDRAVLTSFAARTISLDANPPATNAQTVLIEMSEDWDALPVVGDTLVIPSGSVIEGASAENIGAYVVTAVTASTITAVKLSDAGAGVPVPGTVTPPADVASVALAATTDVVCYSPVTISVEAGDPILGKGKSLEIAELDTGADLLTRTAYDLGTTGAVSWISTEATPALLTSATEYKADLTVERATDGLDEVLTAGGDVALKVGYLGTTATLTITSTHFTTTVTGGVGASLNLPLKQYSTIRALVAYLNVQPGYTAAVGTTVLGTKNPSHLDRVSAVGICSHWGEMPGRIKIDASAFAEALSGSLLVQLNDPEARADAGLPAPMATAEFLAGGARGATTNDDIQSALTALESVRGNILVPCFSRDAVDDIADGLTDDASTYTIESIHAAASAHVNAMSKLKQRRNRQAVLSISGVFNDQRVIAQNIANFRCAMTFQDVRLADSAGDINLYQPWAAACLAAGMQLAAGYKNIELKGIQTSGIAHADGSFNVKNLAHLENALGSGLMPIKPADTGGFVWASDQTTYGTDDNFVYNSMQAVYAADVLSMTMAMKNEQAFVGKSPADLGAPAVRLYNEKLLEQMMDLKYIAPSDGYEKGWKNLKIKITGNVIRVSVQVFLATAYDFVLLDFEFSPVEQTA